MIFFHCLYFVRLIPLVQANSTAQLISNFSLLICNFPLCWGFDLKLASVEDLCTVIFIWALNILKGLIAAVAFILWFLFPGKRRAYGKHPHWILRQREGPYSDSCILSSVNPRVLPEPSLPRTCSTNTPSPPDFEMHSAFSVILKVEHNALISLSFYLVFTWTHLLLIVPILKS